MKEKPSGQTLGFFFTDLYPRDGKYGHFAVFEIKVLKNLLLLLNIKYKLKKSLHLFLIKRGNKLGNQLPVCMMVCNFTKPTHDKPSILTHDELRLFFHEFGNANQKS